MSKAKVEEVKANNFKPIFDRIDCDAGIIFVDTPEETRLIREIFRKYKDDSVQFWSIGQGLHEIERRKVNVDRFYPHKFPSDQARMGKKNLDTKANPINMFAVIEEDCRDKVKPNDAPDRKHIYVLRDLDKFLKDPVILRKLKDLVYLCATACSCIVITGYGITVPIDLEKDAVFVKLKYPTREEIIDGILKDTRNQIIEHNKVSAPKDRIDDQFDDEEVSRACAGLTEDQILNTLQYSMTVYNKVDIATIIEEKRSIINKSDILEYWTCKDGLDSVGGFKKIKDWMAIQKMVMHNIDNAAEFKTEPPKAIMILGVQGSGKTFCAKALAQDLKVSLLKFEIGKVFAGLVGESEKRMRQALTLADAVGGVVVIDELDKGLSGAGSSDKTDGGTTNRVIGSMLTWLNEDHPGLLLIATANDISSLRKNHPELLRKGRFDEIWFSDVPNIEEREEIFRIHLKKRDRDPSKFDLKALAAEEFKGNDGQTYTFTGAEIESAIKDALRNKFALGGGKKIEIGSKDDITTEDIISVLRKLKPITMIGKETITGMRKWSEDNANNVSAGIAKIAKKTGSKAKVNLRNDEDVIL
jgi:AAA+ superfamily predicted ATPase